MNYDANTCGLSWDRQLAYVYVPDDEDMRAIIDSLMAEQFEAWKDQREGGVGADRVLRGDSITTMSADPTTVRWSSENGNLNDSESELIGRLGQFDSTLSHLPIPMQLRIARAIRPEVLGL